jgi:hypothetical protein
LFNWNFRESSVPVNAEYPSAQDHCAGCNHPFEIAAVELSLPANILLFVCPSCGLTKAESPAETSRKLRSRIAELDGLLAQLTPLIRLH